MSKQSIHTYEVEYKSGMRERVRNVLHVEQTVNEGEVLIYFYTTTVPQVFQPHHVMQYYAIEKA